MAFTAASKCLKLTLKMVAAAPSKDETYLRDSESAVMGSV